VGISTAEKSVIIIGAGLAGLATGCYGQMNGFQTRIFEHHTTAGGVAAYWKRKGYLIDGGIHFVMQSPPDTVIDVLYKEMGLDQLQIVPLTCIGKVIDEATGRSIEVTQDLDQAAADMKSFFPDDSKTIDWLIRGAQELQGKNILSMGFGMAKELMGRFGMLKMSWEMRGFLKYMMGKNNQSVAEFCEKTPIHDSWLRFILQNLFLPQVPVWFIKMYLALLGDGMLGLLKNGCEEFVKLVEKRYWNLGGDITYRAKVEEILVEGNQAVGVRLADGSEHRADHVVSAADYHSTIHQLLQGRYTDRKITERFEKWPLLDPFLQVSFGVKRTFPDEPWAVVYRLQKPMQMGSSTIESFFIRICNYAPSLAPKGRTLIQPMIETDWSHWVKLREAPEKYTAEKQRIADECLLRLEAHYPGISKQVEMTDVATPHTYWRYTLNHEGSYMGWSPTPKLLTQLIERTLPGLSNFYLAGQWVTPGGSVPASMITGRNAIEIICQREKQEFMTTRA
jgi:phytoene dehydrogenase-like protein